MILLICRSLCVFGLDSVPSFYCFNFLPLFLCSADARDNLWQRDCDRAADVRRAQVCLPGQVARPEGLCHPALGAQGAQAAHAGLLPHHVVAQPRHRSRRGQSVVSYQEQQAVGKNYILCVSNFLVSCSFQYCVILEEITPAKADSKFTRRLEPRTLRVNNLKPPKTKAISLLAVVKPIADSRKQLILESSYVGASATQMSLDLSDAPDVIPLDDDDAACYASRAIPLTHHAFLSCWRHHHIVQS